MEPGTSAFQPSLAGMKAELDEQLRMLEVQPNQVLSEREEEKAEERVAVQARIEAEERVILSQVAHTFGKLFKDHVLKDEQDIFVAPTLQEMLSNYPQLTDAQRGRFDAVMGVKDGAVPKRLAQADRFLRQLHEQHAPEYGDLSDAVELQAETLSEAVKLQASTLSDAVELQAGTLKGWARDHCHGPAREAISDDIDLLAQWSKVGQPLLIDFSKLPGP